jgi:hypothetical protein
MKRTVTAAAAALLVAGLAGCGGSGSTTSQAASAPTPTPAPTVPAQATPTPTVPAPAPSASPKDAFASQFLTGNRDPKFPAGAPGELTVVAHAQKLDGSSLPIVIRNNTTATIVRPTAAATIRDANGKLVASGDDQTFHPNVVRPGEIAIGYVFFRDGKMPPGSKVEFQLGGQAEDEATYENIRDVLVAEVNFTGDSAIGELKNASGEPVNGPTDVRLTCFTTSGIPLTDTSAFAKPDTMRPGGKASFSIRVPSSCPVYILGASGFAE